MSRKIAIALPAALLVLLIAGSAFTHPFAPALLDLRQWPDGRVDVLWKISLGRSEASAGPEASPDQNERIRPELPAHCRPMTPVHTYLEPDAALMHWTADCGPEGLAGQPLVIHGLAESGRTAVVRYSDARGQQTIAVLLDRVDRTVLGAPRKAGASPGENGSLAVSASYVKLGLSHIAQGIDHLLFVLCLLLWVRRPRRILVAITAFTVAHSVTLALAALGVVHIPPPPVEALIAFSIVLLAAEVVRSASHPEDRPHAFRMAFLFGLLHGFGFAGALAGAGLPENHIAAALLGFNVGVELGQLAFVLVWVGFALILPAAIRQRSLRWRTILAYAAGSVGAAFCIERVVGFWG